LLFIYRRPNKKAKEQKMKDFVGVYLFIFKARKQVSETETLHHFTGVFEYFFFTKSDGS
jgi:hypothetical protein